MTPEKYKIGIIGLGPVGLVLAAHFKEAGCHVEICDLEKEKMNLIRNNGVKLVGRITKTVFFDYTHTSISALLENDLDILISAVKAYHVDSVLKQVETKVSRDLFLLIAQNGIDIKVKYTSHFDESQILRMVINFAGNLQAPNVVNVTFFNPPNYVGSIDDSRINMADWIASILTEMDLETLSKDSFLISNQIWQKTILNAALSPLCAISRMTMKEAMAHPDTLEIVEQIILEAIDVAKAEEVKFGDNFVKLCIRYLKNAGDHFPSLAVDLLSMKPTEIDYMNGKIVEYGRKHYIRTPLNLTFTNLVKAISHKNSQNNGEKESELIKEMHI